MTTNGVTIGAVALNASALPGVSNAVFATWRDTVIHAQLTTPWNETAPWSEMVANQLLMTNEFVPQHDAITPGSGAYINEADFRQPNWQETFFGQIMISC